MLFRVSLLRNKKFIPSTITKRYFSSSKDPVIGPGAQDGTIGSDYDHSVGLERLELLSQLSGKPIFSSYQILTHPKGDGTKGTLSDPVIVETLAGKDDSSAVKERIVGCSGVPKGSHEIGYFWVRSEKESTRCPECGQAFKLDPIL